MSRSVPRDQAPPTVVDNLTGTTGCSRNPDESMLFVDAHVHYHDVFCPAEFLDSTARNFAGQALQRRMENWTGYLLFADPPGRTSLDHMRQFEQSGLLGAWRLIETEEETSLIATSGCNFLVLVAGRQVATVEGLELLSLGTMSDLPQKAQLDDCIYQSQSLGALTILPWGVGKWWFTRGTHVRRVFETHTEQQSQSTGPLFLGDIGGRPAFWCTPHLLRAASTRGLSVLPGSDPLPFRSHARLAGSSGFMLHGSTSRRRPAAALKSHILDKRARLRSYVRTAPLTRFVSDQFRMQLRKLAS